MGPCEVNCRSGTLDENRQALLRIREKVALAICARDAPQVQQQSELPVPLIENGTVRTEGLNCPEIVGLTGFEPATSTPPVLRATKLRYSPIVIRNPGIPHRVLRNAHEWAKF